MREAATGAFLGSIAPKVSRYSAPETTTSTEIDKAGQALAAAPKTLTPEQEEEVREQKRKAAQLQIDATNQVYASLVSREKERGVERRGRTRAIAARSGLLGSDFGEAQFAETERLTSENIAAIEAERAVKLTQILGHADDKAQAEIDKRKAEASKNSEDYLKFLEGQQTRVREDVKGLAGTGLTFAEFRDKLGSDKLQKYLKDTGFNESEFELYYNTNLPKAKQSDYHFENVGDAVRVWQIDASGKLARRADLDIASPPGSPTGEYKTITDGKGQVYVLPEKIDFSKPLSEQGVKLGAPKPEDEDEDPIVTRDLRDAQDAINSGADAEKIRRRFIETHPKKAELYDRYFKTTF